MIEGILKSKIELTEIDNLESKNNIETTPFETESDTSEKLNYNPEDNSEIYFR